MGPLGLEWAGPLGHRGQTARTTRRWRLGESMSQTSLLIVGAICWSIVALDFGIHLVLGDLVVPIAMAAVLVAWIGVRRVPHLLAASADSSREGAVSGG